MDLQNYNELTFEEIKHLDNQGNEFWYARELQKILQYSEWRNFNLTIEKAKTTCELTGNTVIEHFVDVNKSISTGYNSIKQIQDYQLSRYACYLIVQNGDPRKKIIALGQSYFAIKTRQQELQEEFNQLSENSKRLAIREEMKKHNKQLAKTAHTAGIETSKDFSIFQNNGYKGLYGGLGAKDIHKLKGLKDNEDILDNMGSTELAANLFRATQTEEKIRREQIQGKDNANNTHFEVGKKVRETIKQLGGTMPEHLPTPKESIKELKKKQLSNNSQQGTLFDD